MWILEVDIGGDVMWIFSSKNRLGALVTIERQHGDRLKIQAVHENGWLPEWNQQNPQCQVMPGDWITHVNGDGKNVLAMAADIRHGGLSGSMRLTIQSRPRVMEGDIGDIQVLRDPRRHRNLSERSRVGTGDWTRMRETLRSRSML